MKGIHYESFPLYHAVIESPQHRPQFKKYEQEPHSPLANQHKPL